MSKIKNIFGAILIIAGIIILLSSLGLINLGFFAVAETTISEYDGKYIHIPFLGVGSGDLPSQFSLSIMPSALDESACIKVGTFNNGICSISCSIKDYNYTLSPLSKCGKDIPIFTPKEKPQAGSVVWGYLSCNEFNQPTANVIFIPSTGTSCSGEFLVDVNADVISKTCSQSGGDICSASEICANWINASDTGRCCSTNCVAIITCSDSIKNQDEIGIDCGGSCPACAISQKSEQELSKNEQLVQNITAPQLTQLKQRGINYFTIILSVILISSGIFLMLWGRK